MSFLKRVIGVVSILFLIMVMGCASTRSSSQKPGSGQNSSSIEVNNSAYTLADYLRKVVGVYIQGTENNARVYVRGANTIRGDNEPLFVIDGSRLGRSYQRVSSVIDVDDIESVRVLKGTEAGLRYGFEGNAGVIEIKTKRIRK